MNSKILDQRELVFLRWVAPEADDALFLCGDSGQRIYKGRASWLSLGIDVRGRSSSLTVNYRTTEQIRRFADGILKEVTEGGTGETEDRRSVSLLSGPEPRVQAYGTDGRRDRGRVLIDPEVSSLRATSQGTLPSSLTAKLR